MYTLEDVDNMPISEVLAYVHEHMPGKHFWTTESELRIIALNLMKENGDLDPADAALLNVPMFGKIYAMSSGDLVKSLLVLGIDVTPGLSHISAVKRFLEQY